MIYNVIGIALNTGNLQNKNLTHIVNVFKNLYTFYPYEKENKQSLVKNSYWSCCLDIAIFISSYVYQQCFLTKQIR